MTCARVFHCPLSSFVVEQQELAPAKSHHILFPIPDTSAQTASVNIALVITT